MKIRFILSVILWVSITLGACNLSPNTHRPNDLTIKKPLLEEVFADSTYQPTGVAIAADGRLFTNYPYWLDKHKYAVAEIRDGQPMAYPNVEWNSFKKGDNGLNKFVCVQSVVADDKGYLWIVDAAGIGLGEVYQKSNKVVKINLSTNSIERIYRFS
ncbi:hypothetical protein ACFOWA_01290 [Pedobacter lithocola]|uniref:Uncharacterized protein n=1 Tax=Pedobacter lithocola TaxID=1908239 RepID=A0ABV8P3I1_9SPHI